MLLKAIDLYFVVEETPHDRKVLLVTTDKSKCKSILDAEPVYTKLYRVNLDEIFELLLLRIAREVE